MDGDSIRASLKEGEPGGAGLLFPPGGETQDQFWRRIREADAYGDTIAEIRAEGKRLLDEPIPELSYSLFVLFEQTGNRRAFEKVYFEKRRRLNTMAFLSLLEPGDETFRSALHDILWSICNEYTWCLPAHLKHGAEIDGSQRFAVDSPEWSRRERRTQIDLFSAETGFALVEILSLTESGLPPLLRSRIIEEVVQRLFKPYLLQGPYFWETANHNWAAVCAGSIGSAALLLLEDSESLGEIVEKALLAMDHYLAGFGEDGACLEGVGYWNYGFGYFVYFADLLNKRTRGAVDLLRDGKARQIASFQQKVYLDGGLTVNFSDANPYASVQLGLSHYLAGLYPETAAPPSGLRAPYTEDHCSRWAHAFRNLLWFDPRQRGDNWAGGDFYLPDAEWLVSRQVDESGRFGFAAKGGHNFEPHNHNDIGQFILASDGETFVCDLGSGEYTADYFGAGRYGYDCNGSQGHSVPIVDGCYQQEGRENAARDVTASIGDLLDELQFDMAGAYRLPQLNTLHRRFAWHKGSLPRLVLEDTFRFSLQPVSITERIVTRIAPVLEGESSIVLSSGSGRAMVIDYDAAELQPTIERREMRDHSDRETEWFALDFNVRAPKPEQRITLTFRFR
ncbi:heparinase II/III family protein [Paenibacillus sacheonensis]|uniref:Heparinase II/III-like protein n=1 Tax=Paenibacillus sacheonensis TaxID=742054 RepID=A0A7X4YSM2_9BACL|nr:heparinase II/III family protein [Paenibacillus sacheonensis]MBM7569249.1 hypothetical protein [Paenibacillus sacheonensis]NBC71740.1 hypothetical protein [Paenibacillus sacheonensis]